MIRIILTASLCLLFSQFVTAAPPIEAYGQLPSVEMMQLSPSGERYAYITVVGETRRLVVATDKGEPFFFSETGNTKVRDLQWVGDDRLLLWTSKIYDQPLAFTQAYDQPASLAHYSNVGIPLP